MINIEMVLPEFSKMLEQVITKKYNKGVLLSHLAFSDDEHELFGSAIKYCCDYKNVSMTIIGDVNSGSSISINVKEFNYNDVVSLGKEVKELSKKFYEIKINSDEFISYCSNCGNTK
jgi:hypothetical protein